MEYKLSKYNLVATEDENKIIFNSLNNTFCVINNEIYDKCVDFDRLDKKIIHELLDMGIVVESNTDEEKLANIKFMNIITNHDELRLIIMPTMQCNFRCKYCYENYEHGVMLPETENLIIKFVQKNLNGYKSLKISWFGGEPSLCLDLIERINNSCREIAKFYRAKFKSDITSNGYLLSLANFKRLTACHVNMFQITIDGNKENHDFTRPLVNGNTTYNKIIENLLSIKQQIKSRLFTILIRINFTQNMISVFDEIVNGMKNIFGDDERFAFVFREVGDWGGDQVKQIADKLIMKKGMLSEKILNYNGSINLYGQFTNFSRAPFCYAAYHSSFVVNPNGIFEKCTVALNDSYNKVGKLDNFGNLITNEHLSEWHGTIFKAINRQVCKDCPLYANCFGNVCPLNNIKQTRDRTDRCYGLETDLKVMYKTQRNYFKVVEK